MYRYPLILLVLLLTGCSTYHGAFSTRKYTEGLFNNRPGLAGKVESCIPIKSMQSRNNAVSFGVHKAENVNVVDKDYNVNVVDKDYQVFAVKEDKAQNSIVVENRHTVLKTKNYSKIIPGHNDRKKGTSDYSGPTPKPKHTLKTALEIFLGVVVLSLFIVSLWVTLGFLGLLIFLALCILIFAIIILADKHKEADTTLAGDVTNLGQNNTPRPC